MATTGDPHRPAMPRIHALSVDALDEQQRRLAGAIDQRFSEVPNLVLTLLRHPGLYEAWLPMAGRLLLESSFDERERELIILRTAVLVGSAYEWGQHVALSESVLDHDDLASIVSGTLSHWSPREAALLRAVEELHERTGISDETWALLATELDVRQLIELPMLVGQYVMVAMTVHALGVQPEPGSRPLPDA